jgi:hypothetical protein
MKHSVAWVYLPYIAYLGMIIAGLHYQNYWVVGFGIFALYAHEVESELEIICKRPIYNNCQIIQNEYKTK